MKKRLSFFVIICIIGAAALTGALLCEKICDNTRRRHTLDYSDEMLLQLPYFDLLAVKGENRGLPCDIESYSLGDGYIHLVLPEGVDERALAVYIRDINGDFLARRVYDMTQKVMIGSWEIVIDHHVLPVIYFETGDPEVYERMNESETKDIICSGDMQICINRERNPEDAEYISTSDKKKAKLKASLQGRGNDSWGSNRKKSYTLSLKKAHNLLGLGKNKNWNLIGNAYDNSLIKNLTFNEISDQAGIEFQPKMRNVDLYVDGRYEGVYTLSTKVSVDRDRVDLQNGDFFFKMDPPDAEQPIRYESKTWFEDGLSYPVADLRFPKKAGPETISEATKVLQTFIDVIEDPDSGKIADVCDIRSLARYYWIEEASMNFDAWQRSVYMYYRRTDGKMHMGPVWDMDRSLGSPYDKEGMLFDTPFGWKVRNAGWYTRLFENSDFREAVRDEYFNGGIRDVLFGGISAFEKNKSLMGDDGDLNFVIFGHANDIGAPGIFSDAGDYDSYCDSMTHFYRERIEWIDKEMTEESM
ncbi:MAG: CotH kinase family protein [Lachnospiraceae bacterium]|nr:CotH kinase family protein [Lachnospiraceae bacterium]